MKGQLISRSLVLKLSILTEGSFVLLAVIWCAFRDFELPLATSLKGLGLGFLLTLPIFTLNFSVFAILANLRPEYQPFRAFRDGVLRPLCADLDVKSAFFVALSSGVGEELLFRGVFDRELGTFLGQHAGILASSLLFAYVHFIGIFWRFIDLAALYFLCGLYLSYIVVLTGSLVPAIVAHSFYNFVAILYLRYGIKETPEKRDF
jgi:membrane protease YdiL (CAAX protease family)